MANPQTARPSAELTLTAFVSLDGVTQAPGGPEEDTRGGFRHGGWVIPHFDEDLGNEINGIFAKASGFVLGRRTYDIFATHWPHVTDPSDPVAAKLNSLPKFVASRTTSRFAWKTTAGLRNVVDEVRALKARFSGELQLHGSMDLAQTLIENDLIDEYRLAVFPVVLGSGQRLFNNKSVPSELQLVRSRTTSKGVVFSIYRPAGALKTGNVLLSKEEGTYRMETN
jgi:dihydrofolate reductase